MQKGRILLILFIFPFLYSVTVFIFKDTSSSTNTSQVLAAKTAKKSYIKISPTSFISTHSSTPTPTKPTEKKLPTRLAPNLSLSPTDYILEEINKYRIEKGLSKISSNAETCAFAKTRAEEISNKFTHDGFNKRVTDKNLPYSSYQEVTENIAYNTDYTDVVRRWAASPGHEENLRKNTPFICIAKYGDYYVFEGWRP